MIELFYIITLIDIFGNVDYFEFIRRFYIITRESNQIDQNLDFISFLLNFLNFLFQNVLILYYLFHLTISILDFFNRLNYKLKDLHYL